MVVYNETTPVSRKDYLLLNNKNNNGVRLGRKWFAAKNHASFHKRRRLNKTTDVRC